MEQTAATGTARRGGGGGAFAAAFSALLALGLGVTVGGTARAQTAMHPTFQRGVNLSHWLSQPLDESWGRRFGVEGETHTAEGRARLFNANQTAAIARAGFDHIRLLVDWNRLLANDSVEGPQNEDGFSQIDAALEWAGAHGLGVLLTAYTLPGHYFATPAENTIWDSAEQRAAASRLWREIARRYRQRGPELRFELLNEPVPQQPSAWNALAGELLAAVRGVDPVRVVVIGGVRYNEPTALSDLPDFADAHVVYEIHSFEPIIFTFQRMPNVLGNWDPNMQDPLGAIDYPSRNWGLVWKLWGTPAFWAAIRYEGRRLDRDWLRDHLAPAAAFARQRGVAVYCGEFGAVRVADSGARNRWLRDMLELLEGAGMSWAVYDWNGAFAVADADGRPAEALRPFLRRGP